MKDGVDTERRIRVLVIRLSSIGDIVQCTAVARHIHGRFPHGHIDWVVRSDNKELLESNPYVTQTISFDRSEGLKGWLNLSRSLAKEYYTHVYDAHNNWRSRILCRYLKAPLTIRRSKQRWKRLLLHVFKIDLYGPAYRTSASYLKPLEAWGIQNDQHGTELFLSPETLDKTEDLFLDSAKKWIALAPATAWPKKTWPLEYWVELVHLFLTQTDFHILVLGGQNDSFCEKLILNSNRVKNMQGRLSLLESAAAVKNCETLIAADTGILHISEAVGKDVVAILGPTWFGHPQRPKSVGLQTNLWCQPCSKDGSGICINPTYQKCLKLISSEGVFNSFKSLMETRQ